MKLASAAQMRELDRQAIEEIGISSIELMERAAEGVALAALGYLTRPKKAAAAVFCGSGNNGGDGIAAGWMLRERGVDVRVYLVGSREKLTADAREEERRLTESGGTLELFDPESRGQADWVNRCQVIVDAVFGVGLSRDILPESPYARAIALMNGAPAPVVAADIASGVAADSGAVLGCAVRADRTITFTLPKIGQFVGDGAVYSGEVTVWDIGIPEELTQKTVCSVQTVGEELAAECLPLRKADGHKGDFGKLLVIGGAVGYTGAPYLTASAAMRTGCGLVFLGVPESIWQVEAVKCTSAMPFPLPENDGVLSDTALQKIEEKLGGCHVLALGPGLGRSQQVTRLVRDLLERTEQPVVLDADGINALAQHMDILDSRRGRVTILTPHDGEFARLGGDLSRGDRVGAARSFAMQHGCVLVLKGHRTVVAAPEGNVLVNTTGNSGLAKGGSGDVLTGVIASLLAQGATAVQAAVLGVWLHGCAGDTAADWLTEYCVTPEDVIAALPEGIRRILP